MWGPPAPAPHLNSHRPGLLTWGREEAQEKSLDRITNLKTIHNQWTRTIAIGLNTLQRLYNCTHPNRAGISHHWFRTLPYDWSPSKWIALSYVFESGSSPVVDLILPAEVLEAVEPFPDPTKAKSSQRYGTAFLTRSHQSAYRRNAIHHESHPAPPPITRRAVCTESSPNKHG
jgi:hypothetical protein